MNNNNFEDLAEKVIVLRDLLNSSLDGENFGEMIRRSLFCIGDIIRVVDKPFITFCSRHECLSGVDRLLTTISYAGFFWPEIYPGNKYLPLYTILYIIDDNKTVALEKFLNCNTYKKGLVSIDNPIPLGMLKPPPLHSFVIPSEEFNMFFMGLKSDNTMKESKSILNLKDIVLSKEQEIKVRNSLDLVSNSTLKKYKLDKLLSYGSGNIILIHGLPGTGKTMLAKSIAGEMGFKFIEMDYSAFMSKWYSQSVINLANILTQYKDRDDVIILFDEADALFVSRSNDAGDSSTENKRLTNYLLKFIENYKGYIILTTNMVEILDPAVDRRITVKIKMDIPNFQVRKKIWKKFLLGFNGKYDISKISKYKLAGGDIKNAILEYIRQLNTEKESTKLLISCIKTVKDPLVIDIGDTIKRGKISLKV